MGRYNEKGIGREGRRENLAKKIRRNKDEIKDRDKVNREDEYERESEEESGEVEEETGMNVLDK